MHSKNIYYYTGGILIITLIIISSILYSNQANPLFGLSIETVPENAFGSLDSAHIENENVNRQALGIEAGGDYSVSSKMSTRPEAATSMIAPNYLNNYEYIYEGEELIIPNNEMAVLKKLKGTKNVNLSSIINNFNLDTINLNKFSEANIQNISFAQEKDFGYQVYLNFFDGQVSLNQNYSTWPQSEETTCLGDMCEIKSPDSVSLNDIPDDQSLISIADNFLKEYNIDTSLYNPGEVDNRWRSYYEQAEDKANYYIPQIINVLYPLKINNQLVYNEGGNKEGLNVAIHIKYNKVYSLYNLTSQNYQSSMYETETDVNKILEVAKKGGRYMSGYENSGKAIEVKIGTPILSYIKIWQYNNSQNDELLVPAFVFPILEKPEVNYFYQENIIVPLVKSMLNSDNLMPMLMPRIEPAVMEN